MGERENGRRRGGDEGMRGGGVEGGQRGGRGESRFWSEEFLSR